MCFDLARIPQQRAALLALIADPKASDAARLELAKLLALLAALEADTQKENPHGPQS